MPVRFFIIAGCAVAGLCSEPLLQTNRPARQLANAAVISSTGSMVMPQKVRTAKHSPERTKSSMRAETHSRSEKLELAEDRSLATLTALSIVSSLIVIIAPAASVWRVVSGEATPGDASGLALPYFFLFAQSYFWALYGFEVMSKEISDINVLGSLVCLVYLVALGCYAETTSRKSDLEPLRASHSIYRSNDATQNLLAGGVFFIAALSVITLHLEDALRSEVLAYTALSFNIMVYLAPMHQAVNAIRTGSTVGFPFALTVAGFVSCGLWAQYSALTHNMPYLIPNLFGLMFNGSQICIVSWVYIFQKMPEDNGLEEDDAVPSREKLREQRAAVAYGVRIGSKEQSVGGEERLGSQDDEEDCLAALLRRHEDSWSARLEADEEAVQGTPAAIEAPMISASSSVSSPLAQ